MGACEGSFGDHVDRVLESRESELGLGGLPRVEVNCCVLPQLDLLS